LVSPDIKIEALYLIYIISFEAANSCLVNHILKEFKNSLGK